MDKNDICIHLNLIKKTNKQMETTTHDNNHRFTLFSKWFIKLFQINTLCLFACSQNFHSILKWDTELNLHCLLIYSICHVKFNFNGNTVNSTQHFLSPFSRQTFIQQGTTFHNCCPHPWLSQKTKFYLLSQSHLRPYSFNSVNSRSPPRLP